MRRVGTWIAIVLVGLAVAVLAASEIVHFAWNHERSAALAVAIITLAHSLGLSVNAEGVETEAQLDFLRAHGCDEMQGYYFCKPLPGEEIGQRLVCA